MASVTVPPTLRDRLITEFRRFLCTQIDFIPFEHQADWWVTTDGYTLTDHVVDPDTTTDPYITLRLPTSAIESRRLASRPAGRAKVVAELGAYKSGKSAGAGLWGLPLRRSRTPWCIWSGMNTTCVPRSLITSWRPSARSAA